MQVDTHVTTVAFVRCERYGDLLCTMPLILHWGKLFPESSLTLIVSERCASLLPFLRGYDKSWIVPNTSIRRNGIKIKTLLKIRRDHRLHFDLVVSGYPKPSHTVEIILAAFKAKQKVAVIKNGMLQLGNFLINRPVSEKQIKKHQVHQSLACLKILFPEFEEVPETLYPRLYLPKNWAPNSELHEFLKCSDSLLIFISLSNNRENSSFGIRRYVDILNALFEEKKIRVLISCLPQDRLDAEGMIAQLVSPAIIACSEDLGDLLQSMNKADLVFVGDGGLMHMAAALDKFQVALFGKDIVSHWRPLSKKALCLMHPEHVVKIPKDEILEALREQITQLNKC